MNHFLLQSICDESNCLKTDFLLATPRDWAKSCMADRYRIQLSDTDLPGSFAGRCFTKLESEYAAIRSWFDADNKLNPTLRSLFMVQSKVGPLGDGITWDIDGDTLDVGVVSFKSVLLGVSRALGSIPVSMRANGYRQAASLAKAVVSTYQDRAARHTWVARKDLDSAALSRRWAAMTAYTFLLEHAFEPSYAWDLSGCAKAFGPYDNEVTLR